jgi:Tol biopolymer transport system component/DNA-binding winged helix-turn-helix (wHTH) protein
LYEFGKFRLDAEERTLLRDGEPVTLTPKVFDTLLALVESGGRVLTKDELMERLWPDSFVEEWSLSQNISLLRKALDDGASEQKYIETVPKRGYRFTGSVKEITHEQAAPVPAGLELERDASVKDSEPLTVKHDGLNGVSPAAAEQSVAQRQSRPWLWFAGALVVVAAGGLLWLYYPRPVREAIATAAPIKVTPFTSLPGNEVYPAFSPDGSQIAFVHVWNPITGDEPGIYVKRVDGGNLVHITRRLGDYAAPVWSPDGGRIAYMCNCQDVGVALFVVPALGGTERKLYSGNQEGEHFGVISWSPDGKFIVLSDRAAPEADRSYSLYLIDVDSLEKRQISSPPQSYQDRAPAHSPDGKAIAFVRTLGEAADIYIMPAVGGEPTRITTENRPVSSLTWTADGRSIIFSSSREGIYSLWRVAASGGEVEKLAAGTENALYPSASRVGGRLAYQQGFEDSNIWRYDLQKSSRPAPPVKLISSSRGDAGLDISPDGKRVTFDSSRTGSNEIWVCDADGSNPVELTSFGGPHCGAPRWSPDGKKIVFDAKPEGHADIYVIDGEGGLPRRLTATPSDDVTPSWSRDGRSIYFSSDRNGKFQLWKMPAEGGEATKITKGDATLAIESVEGRTIYFTSFFLPGLWSIPVEGGQETRVLDLPDRGAWGYWAINERGIYYLNTRTVPDLTLEFFEFSTRRVTQVARLAKEPRWYAPGFDISADGRWFLYAQIDQRNSDIMLVENFR